MIDFKCWSVVILECFITLSLTDSVKWILQRLFSFLSLSPPPPSFLPAMVQQFHESHLCVAGWQTRPTASYLPTEDAHQDREGKWKVLKCELPSPQAVKTSGKIPSHQRGEKEKRKACCNWVVNVSTYSVRQCT